MNECVFCDIVHNQIPSWIVYQTRDVICFLPKTPEVYGHTIIASKRHIADIYTAPESILENMLVVAKKIAIHYQTQIGATGINILHASGAAAQQSVFHFHIHLIPRFDDDGLNAWPEFSVESYSKDEALKLLRLIE